jgi:hypothetical protein
VSDESIFSYLIALAGGVIAFVIVVGGIVCIFDTSYTFAEYLKDLTNVWPYLAGAIVAVLLRGLTRADNRRKNGNGKKSNGTDKGGGTINN